MTSDPFWLTYAQMAYHERHYLPQSQWLALERCTGEILPGQDAVVAVKALPLRAVMHAGPVNGSDMGVFARIMVGLAAKGLKIGQIAWGRGALAVIISVSAQFIAAIPV